MIQSDKEALREIARAITSIICGSAAFFLFVALFSRPANIKPEEKFVVVDHYKQCEVVRYTDSSSRWH